MTCGSCQVDVVVTVVLVTSRGDVYLCRRCFVEPQPAVIRTRSKR